MEFFTWDNEIPIFNGKVIIHSMVPCKPPTSMSGKVKVIQGSSIQYSMEPMFEDMFQKKLYPLVNSHHYGKSPCYSWENALFLWWFSITMLVYQRVYYCWQLHGSHTFPHSFASIAGCSTLDEKRTSRCSWGVFLLDAEKPWGKPHGKTRKMLTIFHIYMKFSTSRLVMGSLS